MVLRLRATYLVVANVARARMYGVVNLLTDDLLQTSCDMSCSVLTCHIAGVTRTNPRRTIITVTRLEIRTDIDEHMRGR